MSTRTDTLARPLASHHPAVLIFLCLCLGVSRLALGAGAAPVDKSGLSAAECTAMTLLDLSDVEDAPAQIVRATVIEASASHAAYCELEGYVARQVGFNIRLPLADWNGKLLMTGTGGMAGEFLDPAEIGVNENWLNGYAYIRTDGGHKSTGHDAKWAYNNLQALVDYSFRASHVGSIIGKALVRRVYGRAPRYSYFEGCSGGGREALILAQRFPWDFDGIISGAASMRMANVYMAVYWMAQNMADQGRETGLDPTALAVLHQSVMAQCDAIDGVADGLIDDPRRCHPDLNRLRCKAGAARNCLSEAQINVARRIYEGARRSDGSQVATASAMPGSELQWSIVQSEPGLANYPIDIYRYIAFDPPAGPAWTPRDLKLEDYPRRLGLVESLWTATNPDLRQFKRNGGKLISFIGWDDALGGVHESMDYYETVQRTMGGRAATQDFYRLFMVPGMNHCTGGVGAHEVNYLEALVTWKERGMAPDELTGRHPSDSSGPAFARTLKPYVVETQSTADVSSR